MTINYSRREQRGWYFYDWANSAFSTTVVTLFLGPYLTVLAKAGAGTDGYICPLGFPIDPRSYWGYLVAVSVVLQVLCLPLVGAIADATQRKKLFLGLFAYLGALPTAAIFSLKGTAYLLGGLLFLVANVSFGASVVIYNAFLPEIAAERDRDAVSSKGWGLGYLGEGLLLALNLLLYLKGRLVRSERRPGSADQPFLRRRLVGGVHGRSFVRTARAAAWSGVPPPQVFASLVAPYVICGDTRKA